MRIGNKTSCPKKRCFSSCHERGTKKKFRFPMRNRISYLRIPGSDARSVSSNSVYRQSKWFVIKRNGLIVFWRTVYLISRDLFKVQMDKSPLVKWNIQTKNVFYNSETEQPPLLNWFNKNTITKRQLKWFNVEITNGWANCTLVPWLDINGSE